MTFAPGLLSENGTFWTLSRITVSGLENAGML